MTDLQLRVASEEESRAKRQDGAEQLAKIANELRALHRAEQGAGFEMGRLLCQIAGTTWLRVNLPLREDRHDVAKWAKREVGLTYSKTGRLMDVWRVRECFSTGVSEPSSTSQLDPLRPLLKHGKEGKRLINEIWDLACEQSDRKEGPSRSLVGKVAKARAPEYVGKKQQPRSRSKQKALFAIEQLASRYERAALIAALKDYLKENS